MKPTYYIIDFDSTFTDVEAMEELAEISLANDPEKDFLIERIKELTDLAMDGSMPFNKSLKARIALLSAKKYHINLLVNKLRKRVSASFVRNKKFFKNCKGSIYIVSGGFKEFIIPVVKAYHIDPDHVFANTFLYDEKNNIIGADESNLLAEENGKVKLLKKLKLQGEVVVIGDGYTDYQIFESGLAHKFFAYTENVSRGKVLEKASYIAPSLDEILYTQKLPMSISYPKTRLKAVLYGENTFLAQQKLKDEGYQLSFLERKSGIKQVQNEVKDAHVLLFEPEGLDKVMKLKTPKLLSAGVWGELNDQGVYSKTLGQQGVALFANQYAHTRSVTELVLGLLFQFVRMKGQELPGKKLGIVGYGHCGSLLSVLASSLGMEVMFYDTEDRPPLGNAKRIKQLPDLLKKSEMVVMVMGKRFNDNLFIGAKEIKLMPLGAILIHMGGPEKVDTLAILKALKEGRLLGFGSDRMNLNDYKELENNERVILTHKKRLGTEETQRNLAELLCDKTIGFINTGNTIGALSLPDIHIPAQQGGHRFIHIHQNKPGVLAQINGLFAQYKINISGQYLKTNDLLGYVITDLNKEYDAGLLEDLKSIKETIKFRVLY
jgi:D-3-phosphoglycerate dehydrogenase